MEKLNVKSSNTVSPRFQQNILANNKVISPDLTEGEMFANKTLMLQTDATQHEYFDKSAINLPKININTRSKDQQKIAEKAKKFALMK